MVQRLTGGPATVSELAQPLAMSLPAIVQHLHVLPASGLVRSGTTSPTIHEMDFRVGGLEHVSGGSPDGPTFAYDARYQDIVTDERIVSTYEMHMDDARISVSVATVEFRPEGPGTRLVVTEQGAYLDGHDPPAQREHGTGELLDALG